jgi:CheY-like chemotaxis protein
MDTPGKTFILVIDDEPQFRHLFKKKLAKLPYTVVEAENGEQGLRLFRECKPDLIVTDIIMPNKEGIETILELKKAAPGVKIIAVSGGGRNMPGSYLEIAKDFGAERTFAKPVDWKKMLSAIEEMVRK